MGDLSKMDKPKTWGTPCVYCEYRWCFRGRACIRRAMRAAKQAEQLKKQAKEIIDKARQV